MLKFTANPVAFTSSKVVALAFDLDFIPVTRCV
jgi:hypothetical protein